MQHATIGTRWMLLAAAGLGSALAIAAAVFSVGGAAGSTAETHLVHQRDQRATDLAGWTPECLAVLDRAVRRWESPPCIDSALDPDNACAELLAHGSDQLDPAIVALLQ